jgi:hypothetical protein
LKNLPAKRKRMMTNPGDNLVTIEAEFFERRRANDLAASFFSATLSTRCMAILNTIDVNLIQSSEKKIRIQLDASMVHWFHRNKSV